MADYALSTRSFLCYLSSYTGGPSAYNPLNATPCLAEDILDYEGNSFYNLLLNSGGVVIL